MKRGACIGMSLASLLALGGPVTAAVYRWVDDAGVVNYSNDRAHYEAYRRRSGLEPEEVAPVPA